MHSNFKCGQHVVWNEKWKQIIGRESEALKKREKQIDTNDCQRQPEVELSNCEERKYKLGRVDGWERELAFHCSAKRKSIFIVDLGENL